MNDYNIRVGEMWKEKKMFFMKKNLKVIFWEK